MSLSKALQALAKSLGGTLKDNALRQVEKSLQEVASTDLEVGLFDSENATKGAYHEFGTDTVPQRPFLRGALNKNNKELVSTFGKETGQMLEKGQSGPQTLEDIGEEAVNAVRQRMDDGIAPVKADGSRATLQETGEMYDAIAWRLKK